MAITQEFNGDILVDGNVSSDTITAIGATISGAVSASSASISGAVSAGGASITGGLTANTANINGAVTANYLNTTGNATNQTMSQLAITNAINNAITSTLLRARPVGTLYTSTVLTSPASLFGGTWQQLTADAYFKIVTSGAGALGGTSSSHIIPLASMPRHNGHVPELATGSGSYFVPMSAVQPFGKRQFAKHDNTEAEIVIEVAGNSQPYYPYHYGIYAWVRTA